MNSLLNYDKLSRYNDMDNSKVVFLTPNAMEKLNIGIPVHQMFSEDEMDDDFPILLDTLKEMVRETTVGAVNGSEIEFEVQNSNCKVVLCIEINGKLCKLQKEEGSSLGILFSDLKSLSVECQVKIFQRLISEGQITLEDLAVEDIDNSVYKQLVVNDIDGAQICIKKLNYLDKLWESQKNDKQFDRKRKLLSNCN